MVKKVYNAECDKLIDSLLLLLQHIFIRMYVCCGWNVRIWHNHVNSINLNQENMKKNSDMEDQVMKDQNFCMMRVNGYLNKWIGQ